MKKGSTLFLRATVIGMGLVVLALCVIILFGIGNELPSPDKETSYWEFIALAGLFATTIPYYIALFQALKLLDYIDRNKAFSELSVKALRNIKYCGLAISGVYLVGLPFIYRMAEEEDAPGVLLIGLFCTFAPFAVSVFAALAERLLQSAIDLKSENDLTV